MWTSAKTDKSRYSHGEEARPEVIRGHVTSLSVRAVDNAQICEVIDVNGELHTHVETIVQCGGHHEMYSIMPHDIGQEVYLLKTSASEQPYIIGSVFKPAGVAIANEVYPTSRVQDRHIPCTSDYYVSNKGNSLNLSDGYGIQLSTSSDVRIQLPSDGMLRISAGGRAGDCALDGAKFITELYKLLEELHAKQELIEQQLRTLRLLDSALQQQLAAFAATGVANTTGPLAPLNAPFSTLQTALASNEAARTSAENAENTLLNDTPRRTIATSKNDTIKAINHKVRLPK
jgi:hypothetical protein